MRIVEFGVSSTPVFRYSEDVGKKIESGATYVGFDINRKYIGTISREEGISIALGDMGKIPLMDNIADEIWVLNVFGGDFVNIPEKMPDGSIAYTLGVGRHFREMTRILKPGGKIYIGEWRPRISDSSWMKNDDYSEYGLSKKVYEGEALQEFVEQHGFRFGHIWKDTPPFFIELTKSA